MANQSHVEILNKGSEKWNEWRKQNPSVEPDLSEIDLQGQTFTGFNFSKTNFQGATLHQWSVVDCNLEYSNFNNIQAQGSYWRNANLTGASISGDLILSKWYIANLTLASIQGGFLDAEMRFIRLNNTKFSPYFQDTAINSWTILNTDLSTFQRLNALVEYPCNIDLKTIEKSSKGIKGNTEKTHSLSEFFNDCGIPKEIISVFQSWTSEDQKIEEFDYYSCFISYNHSDKQFARELHDALVENGIQCWLDEHQVFPGDDILDQIDEGIRNWDKVLLCCSEPSLSSPWVDREIEKALQKEEELWRKNNKKTLVIIPLNLDNYIFNWESSKASILKSRLAADYTDWNNDKEKMANTTTKIIHALKLNREKNIPKSKL